MNKVDNYSEIPPPVRWSVRQALVLGILLLALALVFGIAFLSKDRRETGPAVTPPPIPIDYERLIAEKVAEASRQVDLAVVRFKENLARAVLNYTAKAEGAALETAEKLSATEDLAIILFYLTKDLTNSANQTNNYIDSETRPILKVVLDDFGREINDLMRRLDNDLRKISMQLAVDLASIGPGKPGVPGNVELTSEVNQKFAEKTKQLGIELTVQSATGIVLTPIFAAIHKAIPIRVAAIATRMFAKQVARLATSSAIASIPTPIPLPQIGSLAGFVWTAYDIWALRDSFRDEIYKAGKTELERVGATVSDYARDFANTESNAYRNFQTAVGRESLESIQGKEGQL